MELTDTHTLYIKARGYSAEEVEAQVEAWTDEAAAHVGIDAAKAYRLAFATDREGTFLDFGYMYCFHPELYHVLTGKQPTGLTCVLVPQQPRPESPVPVPVPWRRMPRMDWAEVSERAHPSALRVPADPLMTMEGTGIKIEQACVRRDDVTRYLRAWNVPESVTLDDLWTMASPYAFELEVVLYRDRREAVLIFPQDSSEANFAAFFLRKVELPSGDVLVFKTVQDPPPRGGDRYP